VALSPTIPTSFVPKQPVSPGSRRGSSGNNIFLYVSLGILIVTLLAAGGVFFYAQYLNSVENAKAAELLAAQNNVSPSAVDSFVRLHNRFIAAEQIITQHVALSQFFTLLASITVQDVHFTSLNITVADDRSAQITMMGDAQNFNALAAESTVFAQQKNITSAIFSNITVNKDGTIGFSLAANLTPALVIENAAPLTPALLAAPPATTTPVTLPATTTTPPPAAASSSTSALPAFPTPAAASASTTSP
jgi:hypothetical protein